MLSSAPMSPTAEEALSLITETARKKQNTLKSYFEDIQALLYYGNDENSLEFSMHTTGVYSVFDGQRYHYFASFDEAQEYYTDFLHSAQDKALMQNTRPSTVPAKSRFQHDSSGMLVSLQDVPDIVEDYGVVFHAEPAEKCTITLAYDEETLNHLLLEDVYVAFDYEAARSYLYEAERRLKHDEEHIAAWFGYEHIAAVYSSPDILAALEDRSPEDIRRILNRQYADVFTFFNTSPELLFTHEDLDGWLNTLGIPLLTARRLVMERIFAGYAKHSQQYDMPLEWALLALNPAEDVLDYIKEVHHKYQRVQQSDNDA